MDTDHMQDADRPHRHGLIGIYRDDVVISALVKCVWDKSWRGTHDPMLTSDAF